MECKHCNNGTEVSTDCTHTPEELHQMFRDKVMADMESSPAYKVGYLSGMARTALYFLYHNKPEAAKHHLEDGFRTLKMEGIINDASR
jgi:hypothetical protein